MLAFATHIHGRESMPELFTTTRRVEFCETDAAGIAHFASFLCYMEQAEHAFLRELGTSVVQPLEDQWHLSFPRVHVECDYSGTAFFEDVLRVDLRVLRLGNKSITYAVQFSRDGVAIAAGKAVVVCCRVRVGCPLESISIPTELALKLGSYLPTGGMTEDG